MTYPVDNTFIATRLKNFNSSFSHSQRENEVYEHGFGKALSSKFNASEKKPADVTLTLESCLCERKITVNLGNFSETLSSKIATHTLVQLLEDLFSFIMYFCHL